MIGPTHALSFPSVTLPKPNYTELVHGPTLWYDGHDGREDVFNRLQHLLPQHDWMDVWMLTRQSRKHLRPDVAGSGTTHTTTCGQYYVTRDRHHTHFEYGVPYLPFVINAFTKKGPAASDAHNACFRRSNRLNYAPH